MEAEKATTLDDVLAQIRNKQTNLLETAKIGDSLVANWLLESPKERAVAFSKFSRMSNQLFQEMLLRLFLSYNNINVLSPTLVTLLNIVNIQTHLFTSTDTMEASLVEGGLPLTAAPAYVRPTIDNVSAEAITGRIAAENSVLSVSSTVNFLVAIKILRNFVPNDDILGEKFVFRNSTTGEGYSWDDIPEPLQKMLQYIYKNDDNLSALNTYAVLADFRVLITHELLHIRMAHIFFAKIWAERYPLPSVVYNIAEDLIINTLLVSFPNLFKRVALNISNSDSTRMATASRLYSDLFERDVTFSTFVQRIQVFHEASPTYATGIHPVLSTWNKDTNVFNKRAKVLKDTYGIDATSEELASMSFDIHSLKKEGILDMDDAALIEYLYNRYRRILDEIDAASTKALQSALEQLSNNSGSQQNGSDENKGNAQSNVQQKKGASNSNSEQAPETAEPNASNENSDTSNNSTTLGKLEKAFTENFKKEIQKSLENNQNAQTKLKELTAKFGPIDPNKLFNNKLMEGIAAQDKVMSNIEASRGESLLKQIVHDIVASQTQGYMPGYLRKLTVRKAKRPTFIELLRKLGRSGTLGGRRPTFAVPNRKISSSSFFLPSKVQNFPTIAVVVDTSGSMGDKEIGFFLGMMRKVMKEFPRGTFYFYWNDADYTVDKFTGRQFSKLEKKIKEGIHGGGGSVFTKVFADRTMKRADFLIFVSDFFIGLPDKPLLKPTLLVPTPNHDKDVLKQATTTVFPKHLVLPLKNKEFEQ